MILAHLGNVEKEKVERRFGSTLVAGGKLRLDGCQFSSIAGNLQEYIDSFHKGMAWVENGGEAEIAFAKEWAADDWRIKAIHYVKHLNQVCAARRMCHPWGPSGLSTGRY
jgi:hypothetical protein